MQSHFQDHLLQFSEAITTIAASIREAPAKRQLYSPLVLGVVDALLHFQDSRNDLAQHGLPSE